MTPARSTGAIRCTTTAIAGSSVIARLSRYDTARGEKSETQQSRMRSSTAALPITLAKLSCIPANDAPAVSSAVADERTATAASGPNRE